jgi:predicted DCC family thiol-disulfide oxidoreductase YuxK
VTELRRPVLLYDSGCRVCRFTARLVQRIDRGQRLAYLPLEADEARSLLERLPEEERMASWRLARPDGTLAGRGAGAPAVLRELGHERVAGVLDAVPETVLEHGYDLVARNRGHIGRLVPNGPAPRRFP